MSFNLLFLIFLISCGVKSPPRPNINNYDQTKLESYLDNLKGLLKSRESNHLVKLLSVEKFKIDFFANNLKNNKDLKNSCIRGRKSLNRYIELKKQLQKYLIKKNIEKTVSVVQENNNFNTSITTLKQCL